MNQLRYLLYSLVFFVSVACFSCRDDYDDFSINKNDTLSFSVDTLSFDTLFSTIGSTTKKFMIYNRHEKPLLISSVGFSSGNKGFRINIPPEIRNENGSFINVRINPKDSLYVFVEATLNENSTNTPQLQEDVIVFTTNGVKQKVLVEAYGQDVVILKNTVFDKSTVLSNEKPYLVYDSIVVNKKVTLTIPEGTTFYMRSKSWFKVEGNIKAQGTHQQPIVFRGHRTDNLLEDLPYDRLPGQWDGIWFATSSYDNEFEHVRIRNSMSAMVFEASSPDALKLKLKNSVLTNASGHLLSAENCNIVIENSELSNAAGALLYLSGGKYSFTHCTFANYLSSINNISPSGQTVVIYNYIFDEKGNKVPLAVTDANFFNSIIYSNNTNAGEYSINEDSKGNPGTPMNYRFQNCLLLKKDGANNETNIINCIFNENPKFIKSTARKVIEEGENNITNDFTYDFRLNPDSISPAFGKADIAIAQQLPYDMNEIYRLNNEGPDIGAYQSTKTE